ncbi:hypothetical protein ACQEVB_07315 [Pseudonocardia sp. CA-107938]|uniref:hypothetical protein n=1 Tax=Pseudonocardia sp. CA-107938 TaxID=3240021 RepID=UPI003D91B073
MTLVFEQRPTQSFCAPPSGVEEWAGILIMNLPKVQEDLNAGAIVVIGDESLRVRRLPIG